MIEFNVPLALGHEVDYVKEAITNKKICGDGPFTKKVSGIIEKDFTCKKVLLTSSCTDALEMCALLLDLEQGDEVICPSYTFVSSALAFAMRNANIVFTDIRPDTMNIDEKKIESAITSKTKAIVVVHYAGVACEMDEIMAIAKRHNLIVIEDAAQGVMSTYKGKYLGTIGHLGAYSFHETKNYSSGEGGCLLINDERFLERAEIIREKGTNRTQFFRGQVDKYSWRDLGSSYLMSDISAAYLYAQISNKEMINDKRLSSWNLYYQTLKPLADKGYLEIPTVPSECVQNAHMFYVKLKDIDQRTDFMRYLRSNEIETVFHYIPLHSSPAGEKYGRFDGVDQYTTKESERLCRLPMHYTLTREEVLEVCRVVKQYFEPIN